MECVCTAKPSKSAASSFANLLRIAGRGLPFTAGDGQTFVRIALPSSGGYLVYRLRSQAFRNWFVANYFGDYNTLPTNHDFRAILYHLEAQANAGTSNQRLAILVPHGRARPRL